MLSLHQKIIHEPNAKPTFKSEFKVWFYEQVLHHMIAQK